MAITVVGGPNEAVDTTATKTRFLVEVAASPRAEAKYKQGPVIDDNMPMVNDCHVQASRLKYYVDEWHKLTSDNNILGLVQHSHLHFSEGFISMQHKNVNLSQKRDLLLMVSLQN